MLNCRSSWRRKESTQSITQVIAEGILEIHPVVLRYGAYHGCTNDNIAVSRSIQLDLPGTLAPYDYLPKAPCA